MRKSATFPGVLQYNTHPHVADMKGVTLNRFNAFVEKTSFGLGSGGTHDIYELSICHFACHRNTEAYNMKYKQQMKDGSVHISSGWGILPIQKFINCSPELQAEIDQLLFATKLQKIA